MNKVYRTPIVVKYSVKGRVVSNRMLRGKTVRLGSAQQNQLRTLSSSIAGVACVLDSGANGWSIIDVGSQPDVKWNGKPFTEEKITGKGVLEIGEHKFEFLEVKRRRSMFGENQEIKKGSQWLTIVKWKGRVVETTDDPEVVAHVKNLQGDRVEIVNFQLPKSPSVAKNRMTIDPEMKKPLIGSFAAFALFLLVLLGFPVTKEEPAKPQDNVYTKMIFDAKVLTQKKAQLVSYGKKSPTGTGNGNGSISEGAKGAPSKAVKAVASLRAAGVQSLISKIALRASASAKMMAALAMTPSAGAAVSKSSLNAMGMPSDSAAKGVAGIIGNGKGFKVGGIGTGGKGGGTGGYKSGSGLGTGATGNGEVGLEDSESVIEGGLDREVIAAVIREHLGQIRYCYERQLSANPDLYGKVKVRFTISGDGGVDSQSVAQTTLKSAMVEECILRRIATWKFPTPKGGTKVLVSYPFLFKSVN
jgi:TonB family protein